MINAITAYFRMSDQFCAIVSLTGTILTVKNYFTLEINQSFVHAAICSSKIVNEKIVKDMHDQTALPKRVASRT